MGCVEHGKDHHCGWAGKRGSGEEACRGCRVHKSCHRSECEGGARSLFWQQTRASKPTNLIQRKIGTSAKTLCPLPPQPCACPPQCWEWRRKATTPSTGFVPPSPENLALTILSWPPHRSAVPNIPLFQSDIVFLLRTAGSPATVWCLVVTTRTLPQSANSTASVSR